VAAGTTAAGDVAMSAGTRSGRRQSAIVIPVPSAEDLVGPFRLRYDPVAAAGVPAHVTLVVPWLAPDTITSAQLADLAEVLSGAEPFEFRLSGVRRFGRSVLWLAPEPAGPFVKLTMMLAERFGTPPYDGEFDEIVPHLTVAHADAGVDLDAVAGELAARLPVRCVAEEAWVMVGDGQRWSTRAAYRMG
jgi:2'-5' RNA ligase